MYQIPNAELFSLNTKNNLIRKALHDELKGKRVIIFAIPGAFTPTCSNSQVPDFDEAYEEIKSLGIDEIYCLAVNDPFVMKAWWKQLKVQNLKYLCDGNAAFLARFEEVAGQNQAEQYYVKKFNKGLGRRAWRFAMIVDNTVVTHIWQEETSSSRDNCEEDPYLETTPESVISTLRNIQSVSASPTKVVEDLSAPQ
jgi:peroxiredoxin